MRQLSRLSLRDLLYILFRDKNKIALIVLVSLIGTGVHLALRDTVYKAESRLLVTLGKEKLAGIEAYNKDNYNILFQERGQDVHNGIEIMKDPHFAYSVLARIKPLLKPEEPPSGSFARLRYDLKQGAARALEYAATSLQRIGLISRLPPEEQAVKELREAVGVEAIEDTNVIRVSFGWKDPKVAALVVNAFVDEFLTQHTRVFSNSGSEGLYLEQIRRSEERLREVESELTAFRTDSGISNLPLQKEILLKELSDHRGKLSDATIRLEENRTLRNAVRQAFAESENWVQTPQATVPVTTDLSSLDKQYFELLARRAQLATTHSSSSPELRQLNEGLVQLRKAKADTLSTFYQINMRAAQEEREILAGQITEKAARLDRLNSTSVRLADLERARTMAEQNYLTYKRKAEELNVSDKLNDPKFSGVRVISAARTPVEPAGPRKALILTLSALFGLFLGIAYSAVGEYFNQTFRNAEDVERILGVRSLLIVPRIGLQAGVRQA